jgi:SM-20-related protein
MGIIIGSTDMIRIAEQLGNTGYIVLNAPLPAALTTQLFARCQADETSRFCKAKIGRGANSHWQPNVRSDSIAWLETANVNDQAYLIWMDKLRLDLNAALLLGLFDYEAHYAIYEAGAAYAKHIDVLQGQANRVVSTVLYLNDDWHHEDGGELILYNKNAEVVLKIEPHYAKMIIFLSADYPHEVLQSHATRRSIAGWFRVRN